MGGIIMDIMRVGGKGTDNLAHAFLTNPDGQVISQRQWKCMTSLNVASVTFTAGETGNKAAIGIAEIGAYAVASLRVTNSTNTKITATFYADRNNSDSSIITDSEGNPITFTIPASTRVLAITPDDLPILHYLDWLNLRLTPASAIVQDGSVKFTIVGRA